MIRTRHKNTYKKILWTFPSTRSVFDSTSFLMKFLWLLLTLLTIITTNQYSSVVAANDITPKNEFLIQKIRVLNGGRYIEIDGIGFEKYPKILFRSTNDTNMCRTNIEPFEVLQMTDNSVLLAINNKTLPTTVQDNWIYFCYQDRPSGRLKHLGDEYKFMR